MTEARQALDLARQHGVTVEARGDKLHLSAPKAPPPEVLNELRSHKSEILTLLAPGTERLAGETFQTTGPPKLDRRAGIPDDWHRGVCTLIKLPCPASVQPARWDRLQLDAATFYETWAAQASALGWTAHDLFGANQTKPIERVDQAGLVVLINGRELAVLTDSEAVIGTRTSASLTYRRKWIEPVPGQVLLWELGDDNTNGETTR